jgi:hypothetical protein
MRNPSIIELLEGGDRRSIARVAEALDRVRGDAKAIAEVARAAEQGPWLVSLRALDLLEKLAQEDAAAVAVHRSLFLGPLAEAEQWEVRLQIVRAIPLFSWTPREARRAIAILRANLDEPQLFVQAWAHDGLARMAERDARLIPEIETRLASLDASEKPAVRARARHIRARLVAVTKPVKTAKPAKRAPRAKNRRT